MAIKKSIPPLGPTLEQLDPVLFGEDGPFSHTQVLRIPLDRTPQMVLHWAATSSLSALEPDTAIELMKQCVRLGGDPLQMDKISLLRASGMLLRADLYEEMEDVWSNSPQLLLARIAPIATAIIKRNTQALAFLLDTAVAFNRMDNPDVTIAVLRGTELIHADAWSLCGLIGTTMPLKILDKSFGLDPADPRQQQRLGTAMERLLEMKWFMTFGNGRSRLEGLCNAFLAEGATPDPVKLQAKGLRPDWLVNCTCRTAAPAQLLSLRRLIAAGFPLSNAEAGTQPVHTAADANNAPAMYALLEAGVDTGCKNERGQSFDQILQASDHPELKDIYRIWLTRREARAAIDSLQHFATLGPTVAPPTNGHP